MRKIIEIQSLKRSQLDQSRLCGFDQEMSDAPEPPLIHQEARFWYVKKGRGKILLQGKQYTLQSGCLVAILPWQVSEVLAVDNTMQYSVIAYHFDTVRRIIKLFYGEDGKPLSMQNLLEENPIVQCEPMQKDEMDYLIGAFRRELGMESTRASVDAKPYESITAVSLLIQLIVMHCRLALKQDKQHHDTKIDAVEILRYLYLHCGEKLTLKKLANTFYCSESTVSADITQITGLSFFDLLNEIRIGKTVNFLLYTDFTLKEMAEILGYVDESHISKVFAARIGTKIGEYRSTYQKIQNICQIEESRTAYKLVNYLYRNYENNLTSKEVANTFGISVIQLHQILLSQVEQNFEDFLNTIRVNRACERLLNTEKTVLEIAMEVGYHTPKTLTRNFLKQKVMTPSAFRKKYKDFC